MYDEHELEYDDFCKHRGYLANQGYTWCEEGYDISRCDICPHREPEHHKVKIASTSSEL